ncbi:hypothetical protein LINPERPRIM_LOCUS40740 [Linum perenne]
MKIASSCHACLVTPAGTYQIVTAITIEARSGFIAAPYHGCDGGGATAAGEDLSADARILKVRWESCLRSGRRENLAAEAADEEESLVTEVDLRREENERGRQDLR